LDRVRSLETKNWRLESKIWEHLEKKGPQVRDWGHYLKTIQDLRAQIFANAMDNTRVVLQIDNACFSADDFRVKDEIELVIHQSVENDIHGLHKVTDDTPVTRLQLETDIKALKEELLFMKKNHEEEVKGLQTQIAASGLTVEVDTPKSQDLAKIMADIRVQYDELPRKKLRRAPQWSPRSPPRLELLRKHSTEMRHTVQSLEIELDWMRNLKASLENSLNETAQRYPAAPGVIAGTDLGRGVAPGPEYEVLLNIKVKLEAEFATYCHLLEDGEDFNLVLMPWTVA
ncbi:hypothetical protein EGM_06947, partial [Macaca fascicularis]